MNQSIIQYKTARLRKFFLDVDIPSVNEHQEDVRPEIMTSWIRSKNAGVNANAHLLPTPLPEEVASGIIDEKWLFRRSLNLEYLQKFYDLLDNNNIALFLTDINLTVFVQRGNSQLLNELNAHHFGLGSNLSENAIGTNAAALCALNKKEACVIGAEHYLEALRPYASSCVPLIDENNENIAGYSIIVTYIRNYSQIQLPMLHLFYTTTRAIIDLHWSKSELFMTNELLRLSIEQHDQGILFVDRSGFILNTNSWFDRNFKFDESKWRGKSLKEILPEIQESIHCMQDGNLIPLHEVHFPQSLHKNKAYFIECQPIKKEGQIIGMIVTFYHRKQVNANIARVCNFNAHFTFDDLIGTSPIFLSVKTAGVNAAFSPSNILITGESGTGKELFAQAMHNASPRLNGPFVSINCAAIPKELIGSELFGYAEGAFTGALKGGSPGKFELADKGTIFLDEIGDMPYDMQTVLLRVLEEKHLTRLGGTHPIPIDVKVIAATNKDLWKSVLDKEFRQDLYFRLNVLKIELPPLRKRREDIPVLIHHFVHQFNQSLNKNIEVSSGVIENCLNYYWHGNVRELRNIIERGMNQCTSSTLSFVDLPRDPSVLPVSTPQNASDGDLYSEKLVIELTQKMNEKKMIEELMHKHRRNKTLVATELGITRATLYKKLKSMALMD